MTSDQAEWLRILSPYRTEPQIHRISPLLEREGVTPAQLEEVLKDPDSFLVGMNNEIPGWSSQYGGHHPAALIAAELVEQTTKRQLALAHARAVLIAAAVQDSSVVETATRLGMKHQNTSRIARNPNSLGSALATLLRRALT